jgi:hypothetical protein
MIFMSRLKFHSAMSVVLELAPSNYHAGNSTSSLPTLAAIAFCVCAVLDCLNAALAKRWIGADACRNNR